MAERAERIAVIAGATRGIGLALVKALAKTWEAQDTVYLTARKPTDGQAAVAQLAGVRAQVRWLPFDMADPMSAQTLAEALGKRHSGIDIAVLNGAYVPRADQPAAADARPMIAANNHGTLRFLRAMAPLLKPNARLVVVASGFGTLKSLPDSLRPAFATNTRDPDEINAAMDRYVAAAEAGTADAEGWPAWVNIPSKVGQVAVTRAFAKQYARREERPPGVLINAACPGLTITDATRDLMDTVFKGRPAQTPEEAARDLLWLITLPAGTSAPYAELVQHRKVLPYGD